MHVECSAPVGFLQMQQSSRQSHRSPVQQWLGHAVRWARIVCDGTFIVRFRFRTASKQFNSLGLMFVLSFCHLTVALPISLRGTNRVTWWQFSWSWPNRSFLLSPFFCSFRTKYRNAICIQSIFMQKLQEILSFCFRFRFGCFSLFWFGSNARLFFPSALRFVGRFVLTVRTVKSINYENASTFWNAMRQSSRE